MDREVLITDIYNRYQIMPCLQDHMLRVGGVCRFLVEHVGSVLTVDERRYLVEVGLLHDLGNIIKFDLELFPQFCEPQGINYWRSVQKDFRQRYGADERQATLQIVRELGVEQSVVKLIETVGFSQAPAVLASGDLRAMICLYADQIVEPSGITNLVSRLEEGRKRYLRRYPLQSDDQKFVVCRQALYEIQKIIFSYADIPVEAVTEQSIDWQKMKDYKIKVAHY